MTAPAPFETEPFGRYYLVDKVATGGMAEVFKAKSFSHGGFEKLLVVKRILEHLSDNQEFVEMFIDEAKITVSLQHPNIVDIYHFGKIRENYYLSMECVDGKDVKGILRKLARRRKLFPIEFAVYVAHEMSKGLYYAHTRADAAGTPLHIIHRDISPSNILVSYTGDVKIADFGIAKAESSAYDTKGGVLKGKFEYMSPEQASGTEGRDLDFRTDIFSAGIIMHEMLTGRRLFKTDGDVKTLEKIKAVDIQPPSALNPNIPARLDEIVMKALSRNADDRFADARELQQALREFMYPATPDLTREGLAHFMQELFSQEIEEERERLDVGTRTASEMYANAGEPGDEEEWQAGATTSGTLHKAPSRWPVAVAVIAVLLLGAVVTWAVTREPQERVVERVVEAEAPTTGAVQLRIEPVEAVAQIYLDGTLIGEGSTVSTTDLPVGQGRILRVQAEGFETWEEPVNIIAGERLRSKITLVALAAEADPSTVPPPIDPPVAVVSPTPTEKSPTFTVKEVGVTASFSSSPSGATVTVDGSRIGTTPVSWTKGVPGKAYSVVLSKDGYESSSFTATLPASGSESFSRSLSQKAVEPGTLQVFSGKAGPASVAVNGKSWGESPPLIKRDVPPGTYTITVTPKDGTEPVTRTVTVSSGNTAKATF